MSHFLLIRLKLGHSQGTEVQVSEKGQWGHSNRERFLVPDSHCFCGSAVSLGTVGYGKITGKAHLSHPTLAM